MTTKLSALCLVLVAGLLLASRPAAACGPYEITPEMRVEWGVQSHFYTAWHEQKNTKARVYVQSVHFVNDLALASVELVIDGQTSHEVVVLERDDEARTWKVNSRIPTPRPAPEALAKR